MKCPKSEEFSEKAVTSLSGGGHFGCFPLAFAPYMPKKGPLLAIWSDRNDSNIFCYLESDRSTLETAGSSRWGLFSHLDPILFTVWTPHTVRVENVL